MALLGAILPAWGYHRDPPDFVAVGNYFLSLAVGLVAATLFARRLMEQRGVGFVLVLGCAADPALWWTSLHEDKRLSRGGSRHEPPTIIDGRNWVEA